jgi:hypothetical protein
VFPSALVDLELAVEPCTEKEPKYDFSLNKKYHELSLHTTATVLNRKYKQSMLIYYNYRV